jgi:hypothetical protein
MELLISMRDKKAEIHFLPKYLEGAIDRHIRPARRRTQRTKGSIMMLPEMTLSIRQPWAWLIVNGFKDIENREWPTKHRGPLAIHAAKTMTRADYEACALFLETMNTVPPQLPPFERLPRGGIVGSCLLADCREESDSEWFTGPYGFLLANAKPLIIPCNGRLGIFEYRHLLPAAPLAPLPPLPPLPPVKTP